MFKKSPSRRRFLRNIAAVASIPVVPGAISGCAAQDAGARSGARATGADRAQRGATSGGRLPSINFVKGQPAQFRLPLPAGYRYTGGYRNRRSGYFDFYDDDALGGVRFDHAAVAFTYDGRDPMTYAPHPANPGPQYWVGVESGSLSPRWSAPTLFPIPQPQLVGNAYESRGIANHCKHVAALAIGDDVWYFGGDYSTYRILDGQSGRPTIWRQHVPSNGWTLAFDPRTLAPGDVVPLGPDMLGACLLPGRKVFLQYGRVRTDGAWTLPGTALPPDAMEANPANIPNFIYDLDTGKFIALPGGSAAIQDGCYACAFDDASQRIYTIVAAPGPGITVAWRDAGTFNTTGWQHAVVAAATGHESALPMTHMGLHYDASKRLLYYFDSAPSAMAITLPGHPLGAHRMLEVAPYRGIDLIHIGNGGGANYAVSAWMPEHRTIVAFAEPSLHNVGPDSLSIEINVDTGAVAQGPRFPGRGAAGEKPWTPNCVAWTPHGLLAMGFVSFYDFEEPPAETPQVTCLYAYDPTKPVAGVPLSPWSWTQVTIEVRDPGATNSVVQFVGGNTIADVDPDPRRAAPYAGVSGIGGILEYSGMAVNPYNPDGEEIIVSGGGHGAYGGNLALRYAIARASWSRVNEPSSALPPIYHGDAVSGAGVEFGEYADGTPAAAHTYSILVCVPGGNRGLLVRYCTASWPWNSGFAPWAHALDLDTGDWVRFSVNAAPCDWNRWPAVTVCYDDQRGRIWGLGRQFSYLDLATRRFSGAIGGARAAVGYLPCSPRVPVRDLMVTIGGHYEERLRPKLAAIDLANPERGAVALVTSGDPLPASRNAAWGFDWDTANDVGYLFHGNTDSSDKDGDSDLAHVYRLEPPAAGRELAAPWTVTRIALPAPLPANQADGVYSHWRYVPSLRRLAYVSTASDKLALWTP